MKFQDFQAPVLFSYFQGLEFKRKIQVLSRMRGNPGYCSSQLFVLQKHQYSCISYQTFMATVGLKICSQCTPWPCGLK